MKKMPRSVTAVLVCAFVGNVTITLGIIIEAVLVRHAAPVATLLRLLQWDASNALGAVAYSRGWSAALLGFAMDLVVAAAWAAVFVIALKTVPAIGRHLIVSGLLFGIVVMAVMFYIVVPIGRAQPPSNSVTAIILSLIAHTVFFGLPVALVAGRIVRTGPEDMLLMRAATIRSRNQA